MRGLANVVVAAALCGCEASVQHGLAEREANDAVTVLAAHGYRAQVVREEGKKGTWAVAVEPGDADEARALVSALALPRVERATTRAIVQAPALVDSASVERLRQLEAQEGDIEEALERVDGVLLAAVELAVPAGGREDPVAPAMKAAVLLRVRDDAAERLLGRRDELARLVAASVDGLAPEDVVLAMDAVALPRRAPPERARAVWPWAGAGVLAAAVAAVAWLRRRSPKRASAVRTGETDPLAPVIKPQVRKAS
jgi:type III secretion protein J